MIKSLLEKTWLRYLLIGGLSYVIEVAALAGLHYGLQLSALMSVAISFVIGFLVSYILQKIIVFRNKVRTKKVVFVQLLSYSALVAWNYIFTLVVVGLFEHIVPVVILRTIVIAVTTVWNYVIYKKIFTPMTKTAKAKRKRALKRYFKSKQFAALYVRGAIIILLLTTILWSILGAQIQLANADQLANSFLMQNMEVFHGAILPDAHSFLLKLPFFWVTQLLGATPFWFSAITVILVVATVGGLAYILSRIEKRPVVLGTIYLGLALCLLLTPTQPAIGSLLPTSFAMMTTRNIEYIVFIIGLMLIIKSPRIRSYSFVAACLVLGLLFASDKLFFSLSLGGGLLALATYVVFRRRPLIYLSLRWVLATLVGFGIALGTLYILNTTNLLHTSSSVGAGPYGLIHSPKEFLNGMFYAVAGIFTNFGANPVADVNIILDIPKALFNRLFSLPILGFTATIAITVSAIVAMYLIIVRSIRRPVPVKKRAKIKPIPEAMQLSILLIWGSIAMLGIFVLSNHYYPVDSRYITIILFAGFIGLSTLLRTRRFIRKQLVIAGAVLVMIIMTTIPFVFANYTSNDIASKDLDDRNATIAQIIKTHPTHTLIGDYWRVLPIKLQLPNTTVTPLGSCTANRDLLTSTAWQPDLHKRSFTYLLSLDTQLAGFPHCNLADITAVYGKPNSSAVVRGTLAEPKELLLFYDSGINTASLKKTNVTPDTVIPLLLKDIPFKNCVGSTVMQFVAHEDDDILFMNPDLLHDINKGNCVRTVYFTAGDAGSDTIYWNGRQKGAEAAYDAMLGKDKQVWIERIVRLPGGQFATISNPRGNSKISLVFLHLPDGNTDGTGFPATNHESLVKLKTGQVAALHAIDKSSSYTSDQLTSTLESLMNIYKPSRIRSQSSYVGHMYKDHSDHTSVAHYTTAAYSRYITESPSSSITYYMGYPVHGLPENVSAEDFQPKARAFLAFAQFDGAVCQVIEECEARTVYGIYLHRQYTHEN